MSLAEVKRLASEKKEAQGADLQLKENVSTVWGWFNYSWNSAKENKLGPCVCDPFPLVNWNIKLMSNALLSHMWHTLLFMKYTRSNNIAKHQNENDGLKCQAVHRSQPRKEESNRRASASSPIQVYF